MIPIFPHKPHAPFPIALVNRRPWGAPNHECVNVPQNEAWLSGIRNAKSKVFIQTPNLNAAPLLPALRDAVCRGIEVTLYVCMGYNDAGELLPFQGGNNEMVANGLCEGLSAEEKKRLRVHYYVAKDQVEPIHNKFKARSCHSKFSAVAFVPSQNMTSEPDRLPEASPCPALWTNANIVTSQAHDRRRASRHSR
jgi:hypothetical protein